MNKGWPVAYVMCFVSYTLGARDPIAFVWLASVARFVYGFDRFDDTDDTAESVALALAVSLAAVHARSLDVIGPIPSFVAQTYPNFKRRCALIKPIYVGLAWACATSVVPRCMENRAPDAREFAGVACLASAVSNHADIGDMDEDAKNGITTIPLKFGRKAAVRISAGATLAALTLLFKSQRSQTNASIAASENLPARRNTLQECSPSRYPALASPHASVSAEAGRVKSEGRTCVVRAKGGKCTQWESTAAGARRYCRSPPIRLRSKLSARDLHLHRSSIPRSMPWA